MKFIKMKFQVILIFFAFIFSFSNFIESGHLNKRQTTGIMKTFLNDKENIFNYKYDIIYLIEKDAT